MPSVEIVMSQVRGLERLAFTMRGLTPPQWIGRSYLFPLGCLVPTRFRKFHHGYAVSHGFFWHPCPRCGREFGGHEVSTYDIPDIHTRGSFHMACTFCSVEHENARRAQIMGWIDEWTP